MDLAKVDLYQVHWPTPLVSIERLMDAMAEAVHQGFVRAVGVSNFGIRDLLRAHGALARHGIPLASNQVHYGLLKRDVEKDGVLGACKELGIRLIAHTPLERGLLSGKYGPHRPPSGPRGAAYLTLMPKIPPLLQTLTAIGQAHGGRTCAQVALNWLICKGALPIPGAKSAAQAAENMGASGWQLSADDIAALDSLSDEIRR
jgi:aryl-alcohol dehydrogenase-like predicted oxidoreductase